MIWVSPDSTAAIAGSASGFMFMNHWVEINGSTNVGQGNGLVVRRDVPYLLR